MSETNQQNPSPCTEPALRRFLDADGRLRVWPSRRKYQLVVLQYLASSFEPGRAYSEREVNEILRARHTFGDWALLRRALFDFRFLDRRSDGSSYWRLADPEPLPE